MIEMKIIDRYVLRKFLSLWILSILAFLTIFHIVDVIEKIDLFLKYNLTLKQVLLFYYYQFPWFLNITIPMSVLLASVFTIGNLAKHNELTAIKSSSISMYRLSAPIIIFGIFFFEDLVVIPATRERMNMQNTLMHKYRKRSKTVFDNITFQESPNRNIVIKRFYLKENTGNTITIQENRNNKLVRRLDAKKMVWQEETKDWLVMDFIIRDFEGKTTEKASLLKSDTIMKLDFHPDDIANTVLKPEEMNYAELKNFINRLKYSGNDSKKWEVNLYYKTAFSMTSLIVILFGLPLTAYKIRKGTSFGAGLSLLVIFFYYGFITFGKALGIKGILPPFTSAWMANYFFLSIGLFMFYKIKQ